MIEEADGSSRRPSTRLHGKMKLSRLHRCSECWTVCHAVLVVSF